MLLKTQAATEIAQFLVNHPTPEQIVAFHPSFEVAERAYELIHRHHPECCVKMSSQQTSRDRRPSHPLQRN